MRSADWEKEMNDELAEFDALVTGTRGSVAEDGNQAWSHVMDDELQQQLRSPPR